jgi:hypothetical protein
MPRYQPQAVNAEIGGLPGKGGLFRLKVAKICDSRSRVESGFPFVTGPCRVRQYLTNLGLGFGCLRFQRRKRLALKQNVSLVRPSIGQALANDALGQFVRAGAYHRCQEQDETYFGKARVWANGRVCPPNIR